MNIYWDNIFFLLQSIGIREWILHNIGVGVESQKDTDKKYPQISQHAATRLPPLALERVRHHQESAIFRVDLRSAEEDEVDEEEAVEDNEEAPADPPADTSLGLPEEGLIGGEEDHDRYHRGDCEGEVGGVGQDLGQGP